MVGLGAAPAILQFGLLYFLPETPRWSIKSGNTQQAHDVLKKVYGGSRSLIEETLRAIDCEISEENAASKLISTSRESSRYPRLRKLQSVSTSLFHIGGNRRALTITCMLQGLQQLCGFVRISGFLRRTY